MILRKSAQPPGGKMAGDITLSEKPGESLKKWRLNFEISQTDIANYLRSLPPLSAIMKAEAKVSRDTDRPEDRESLR